LITGFENTPTGQAQIAKLGAVNNQGLFTVRWEFWRYTESQYHRREGKITGAILHGQDYF